MIYRMTLYVTDLSNETSGIPLQDCNMEVYYMLLGCNRFYNRLYHCYDAA